MVEKKFLKKAPKFPKEFYRKRQHSKYIRKTQQNLIKEKLSLQYFLWCVYKQTFSARLMTEAAEFRFRTGQLIQLTNMQSELSSLSHKARAKMSPRKRTFKQSGQAFFFFFKCLMATR